jgi:hypothetical protein
LTTTCGPGCSSLDMHRDFMVIHTELTNKNSDINVNYPFGNLLQFAMVQITYYLLSLMIYRLNKLCFIKQLLTYRRVTKNIGAYDDFACVKDGGHTMEYFPPNHIGALRCHDFGESPPSFEHLVLSNMFLHFFKFQSQFLSEQTVYQRSKFVSVPFFFVTLW